ncbi:PAS/PAC sensor signal transduction histidine kinase [Desulforamulus reducens MI-1]|uniref:histidine kinase n=1 Tax=Desulforamulus reducens (strain ATCC BAA-1160 / DSM 100696 / MI-1) TaxID=349161 RepID=A4J442_DESRM|nr:two-component system sensor histidine kinase AtoS [Desulforamulus reducens]ABO49845.1 PAS/PAC sensor signal transduction histidine kinase [Desulforamulus reducens MI-1]
MINKFRNQLMVLIGVLLLLPVLIIGAMLYMVNHTKPMVLDEQRQLLSLAVEELSQTIPSNVSELMRKQSVIKKNRTEQIKGLNRELAGAVMKVFQKYQGIELGYYSPEMKAILVQMGQDSHLPYMDFKDLFLDVSEDTLWSEQAQWKDAFDKVLWAKKPLEIVLGPPGNQKLVIFSPIIVGDHVEAVIWAGERLGGINKEILQAESFAYTVIFFGFMLGLCSTFFLLKNYLDTVANIKTGVQRLENDLTYVIPPTMGELGEISIAINNLAARLVNAQNYNEIIMASIDAGIVAVDMEGKIVSVNSTARKIFRLEEDVLGKHFHKVFSNNQDLINLLTNCLKGQETKEYITKHSSPQELQLMANTSILFDPHKKVVGAILSCRDVTARMRLEEQMRRQERLAALGKLVTGVAHEIKNPLTSISGYIQFWLKSKSPTTKSLNTIYREVRRLDSIVNKLLFFSRPTHAVMSKVSLNEFVDRVLNFFKETHADNICFTICCEENLPKVYIDPDQVEQVLMNIIYNGVQAMPEGGEISVETGSSKSDTMIYVEIRDTGFGIENELLEKIFDPFFTTRAKGTGLGLTIADEIIRSHGGRIEIKSQVGVGTIVRVLFPIDS